ncbi:HTH-type transcriptional activator IlvY [Kineobactrum salinum]|uniref:HTH-type transcriptional activator IlvY n=1 Tax=Kineobactrum salinum TaxID=2708301 RepID=A0A6C0U3E2_9GAMM|nr:HTH-type transcriptional activator IlvY [Kineobactrum salinum]QIB66363.1 HTH-type transcriptional activator IlvY [Kineobactrum salinum]
MDTRTLQVFLSVADTLNFSRSALRLHLSVSAVSRTVLRLEDELGQRVLERDKRSMRLTPAGQAFREYAQRTLLEWQDVRRQLRGDTRLAGEVSLFCSVTASYSILAPVLEAFRLRQPGVEIMMHTGDQADGIERVLSGQDDVAVSARPARLSPRLMFLSLQQTPMLICMPAADCAVRRAMLAGDPGSADFDWSDIPFIVPERGSSKEMLDSWFERRNARPRIYAQVAGHEAIVAMVGLGLGVGIAPELVVQTSGMAGRISPVTACESLPPLDIGLCSLASRLADPRLESLWEVAQQTYGVAL